MTLVIEGKRQRLCRSGEEYHSEESTVKSVHAINADTVTVNILGFAEDFADINPESITGTIDASGFNTGVLAAEVKLDGNYSVSETIYTAVTVTEKSSSGNSGSDSNSEGANSSSQ